MVLDGCGKWKTRLPSTRGNLGTPKGQSSTCPCHRQPDGLIKVNNAYGPAGDGLTSVNFTRV
jgi:hypothetical protein